MFFRVCLFFLLALPVIARAQSASVTLTAYNAVPSQTNGDPHTNSAGTSTNHATQLALSPNLKKNFPDGTIVKIAGPEKEQPTRCGFSAVKDLVHPYRIVTDVTSKKYKDVADILLPEVDRVAPNGARKTASDVLGHCAGATITAVGYVDVLQAPKTAEGLAKLVAERAVEVAEVPGVPRPK